MSIMSGLFPATNVGVGTQLYFQNNSASTLLHGFIDAAAPHEDHYIIQEPATLTEPPSACTPAIALWSFCDPKRFHFQGQPLREHQVAFSDKLERDCLNQVSPWLGVAAPMQTGKSWIAGHIAQRLGHLYDEVVVLSYDKIATAQIYQDLQSGLPAEQIGRFDGSSKDRQRVTVVSILSAIRHLDDFEPGIKRLVIMDEAYSTQANSAQRIIEHFGLARIEEGQAHPIASESLLIGLSGTGAGLEGYHKTAELDLLTAIESGLVRHMTGDRVFPETSVVKKSATQEGKMIWWKATADNAKQLADIYDREIYDKGYRKTPIYVPTIKHGELLTAELRARHGNDFVFFIHSGPDPEKDPFEASVMRWQTNGGALISIRQLARSFRGGGGKAGQLRTDSVFHTYQSSSPELFAQRTGRAWAGVPGEEVPPLYVLEAAWSRKSSFANLARLLGLVDYPHRRISTRGLRDKVKKIRARQEQEKEVEHQVKLGTVEPMLTSVPLLPEWQQTIKRIIREAGGIKALAAQPNYLTEERIAGYALGALPTRLYHIFSIRELLGGQGPTEALWVRLWAQVVAETLGGERKIHDKLEAKLVKWQQSDANDPRHLDEILKQVFDPPKRTRLGYGYSELLRDIEENPSIGKIWSKQELEAHIEGWIISFRNDTGRFGQRKIAATERKLQVFRQVWLQDPPTALRTLAAEFNVSGSTIQQDAVRTLKSLRAYLRGISIRERKDRQREKTLQLEIDKLEFSVRTANALERAGIETVEDLVGLTESQLLEDKGLKKKSFDEVEAALRRMGLQLEEDVNPGLRKRYYDPIEDLEISPRTYTSLKHADIHFLGQLATRSETELLGMWRFGRKSLKEVKWALSNLGLSVGMKEPILPGQDQS